MAQTPEEVAAAARRGVPDEQRPTPDVGGARAGISLGSEPMLQFFTYDHLPGNLQATSKAFADLAFELVQSVPRNPERTVALRKLLEAKDCAVRAMIYKG